MKHGKFAGPPILFCNSTFFYHKNVDDEDQNSRSLGCRVIPYARA